MCMGGGGGGSGGGGSGGGGGGFSGFDFSGFTPNMNLGGGDITLPDGMSGITTTPFDPNLEEGQKGYLGKAPGFSEEKLKQLAAKSGSSSLYIS